MFGSRLHYFIAPEGRELGCIAFSAPSWALEARDSWIGWSSSEKRERLSLM
jgi:hypothetical protein